MTKFSNYKYILSIWIKEYGPVPDKPRVINLTQTKQRKCVVCGRRNDLHRHHKAHDFYFACLRPDLYAARYIRFLDEDIDLLCDKCHKAFHKRLKPLVREANVTLSSKIRVGKPTRTECEQWRAIFLETYNKWVDRRRTRIARLVHKEGTRSRKSKSTRNRKRNN